MKLSPTMKEALGHAKAARSLVRARGGFWTYPGCLCKERPFVGSAFVPEWSVDTHTVKALRKRGLLDPPLGASHFVTICPITEEGRNTLL